MSRYTKAAPARRRSFPSLKADFVIANPPFNQKKWGADRVTR